MIRKPSALLLLSVVSALGAQSGNRPAKPIAVIINASKADSPMFLYNYGQFIEHIGDLTNRSLWAEMLDERRFLLSHRLKACGAEPSARNSG